MEIKRSVYQYLRKELEEPQILILTGPRQVGKTTLLRQLEQDAQKAGKKTRFFDLEQPADLNFLSGDRRSVIQKLVQDADVVFVDEFYYLENAGSIFKAIYDQRSSRKGRIKIVASGSSSVEIHSHLKESLAGRLLSYKIYPLSFSEYSNWESPLRPDLIRYLQYGGLPGLSKVESEDRKQRLIEDYLATYLFKDVKGLIKEENIRAFNHLLYMLAQDQGQLVEVSNLSRTLGMSAPTIARYLEVMEQTFVNFSVGSYHTNLANELKKSHKTYLYDLGVRNAILKDFRSIEEREDSGKIYETFVFLNLLPQLSPNMELKFWRTKKKEEVDFVLLINRQPIPIEVKQKVDERTVPQGLMAFCRRYPRVKSTFTVSMQAHETVKIEGIAHHFISFEQVESVVLK
ncbi:MAG: ATP-binding protein [Planctomycetes bacterium]|nr:ATP-binding protein [Planctomycetota bacterium]